MKNVIVVFFLFPSFYYVNAQVENSTNPEQEKTLISATAEKTTPYVIPKYKLHVDETTYYSYSDQVFLRLNNKPLNGAVYERWRNGMMWWETHYKNGVKDGFNREWYKSGELFKESIYKDGKLVSQNCWDEEGVPFECD